MRLTPLEALKAITLWGASPALEEQSKGSLQLGKLADLVILDRIPLKRDPMTSKDITVLETIKEGRTTGCEHEIAALAVTSRASRR